jgi:hypothetical protein
MLVALKEKGLNFDECKPRGPQEQHLVSTWNLETISAFAERERKSKKTYV